MKLGHIHIKVRKLKPSIEFYRKVFDLEVTEQVGDTFAFLTGNDMHHRIALQAKGKDAESPAPGNLGLFHTAFEADDKKEFARKYKTLREMEIQPFTIDHLISWALYFDDPDGNGLEIYVDTRTEPDGSTLWKGFDRPLPEEKILSHL